MSLVCPTFDSVSFSPFWIQLGHPQQIPYSVYYSPDGTKHCFLAAFTVNYDLAGSGPISSALFALLKAKLGTTAALVTTQGTATATLVRIDAVPIPGNPGGGGHMVNVSLGFLLRTPFS